MTRLAHAYAGGTAMDSALLYTKSVVRTWTSLCSGGKTVEPRRSYRPWTRPLKTWLFPASVASHSTDDRRICESAITICFMSGLRIGSSSTHCLASVASYKAKRQNDLANYVHINGDMDIFFPSINRNCWSMNLPWKDNHAGTSPSNWDQYIPSRQTYSRNRGNFWELLASAIINGNKVIYQSKRYSLMHMVHCICQA